MSHSEDTTVQLPLPPEALGGWPIGSAREFAADPLGFVSDNVPKFDGIFQVKSLFFKLSPYFDRMVVVSDPDMVKHIMQDNNRNYCKSYAYKVLEALLGQGLLTSEGDFWRKQRRLMQPAFHKERMNAFTSIMTDAGQELVDRWSKVEEGTEVNVSKDLMRMTLDIVCKSMFSADVSDAMDVVNREFDKANEMLIKRIMSPIKVPLWLPTPGNLNETRTYAAIKAVIADIIRKRRAGGGRYDDLLAMLMEMRDEDTGESMSDEQIQDEVITIFLAGHETTAVALSWLFYNLDAYPEVEQRLVDEEKQVLNGRAPLMDDTRTLTYARMVIDETLRLYPPAWVIGRHSLDEDQLGNYRIPPRTNCMIAVYQIHRDPKHWPDPERFIPERFAKENAQGRHKFVYFPFGGGPRLCIGNNFALMEMQFIVPMVLRNFKLRLPNGANYTKDPLITMRPHEDLRMVISRREAFS